MTAARLDAFASVADGGAALAAALDADELARFQPEAGPLAPALGRWDAIQHGPELDANQSDCNWFAWEARDATGGGRFAGIVALHRTGPRLAALDLGGPAAPVADAPRSLRPVLSTLGSLLPVRPRFDPRPLLLSVLYDLDGSDRPAACFETPVEGDLDPERFSFASRDARQQLVVGTARELRAALPPVHRAFFAYEGPAFAIRTSTERDELELFLRPRKDPVAYGPGGTPALRCGRTVIHYVQRPRLDAIGLLRRRAWREPWRDPVVLRGDATQDRHWMTLTAFRLRWLWFMARLDDGRECMAFEMRTADGGRFAPADAGRVVGGGAWLVERSGAVRAMERWSLVPERHERRSRGLVPTRFCLTLPDAGLRLVVAHERATFVPTRALGEFVEAGVWESPARLVEAEGVSGGRFWVDVMPPYGGA